MGKEKITAIILAEELKKTTGEEGFKVLASKAIAALSDAENQIESAEKLIDEQNKAVEKARTSNPNYRPTVTLNKKQYQVNHPVRTDGGAVKSLEDIAGDLKLVAELVKNKSTAISELTED